MWTFYDWDYKAKSVLQKSEDSLAHKTRFVTTHSSIIDLRINLKVYCRKKSGKNLLANV